MEGINSKGIKFCEIIIRIINYGLNVINEIEIVKFYFLNQSILW